LLLVLSGIASLSGDRASILSFGPLRTRLVTRASVLIAEGGVGVGPAELRLIMQAELGGVLAGDAIFGGEGQNAKLASPPPMTAALIFAFGRVEQGGAPDAIVGTCDCSSPLVVFGTLVLIGRLGLLPGGCSERKNRLS